MPTTLKKRRTYRRRTARSLCRKKDGKKCLHVKGCKQTKKTMKRKSYLRKSKKHMVKGGVNEGETIKGTDGYMYFVGNHPEIFKYLNKYVDPTRNIPMVKSIFMYDDVDTQNIDPTILVLGKPIQYEKYIHINFHIKNDTQNKYYILYKPDRQYYDIYDSQYDDTIDKKRNTENVPLRNKLAIRQYSQNISAAIQHLQGDKKHMKDISNPLLAEERNENN